MSTSWQNVQDEALRRIHSREWPPGAQIPNEADLARELGCARATVNRALRALAQAGWLERRRRAGTRVAVAPLRQAQLAIPIIRHEIEARGQTYSHGLLTRRTGPMPPQVCASLGVPQDVPAQEVRTLHLADGRTYALEHRWVYLAAVPGFADANLEEISPNEWLVLNAPFDHGTFDYSAVAADAEMSTHLECPAGTPVMMLERRTFGPTTPVTHVRLAYAPGFRLHLSI
ncbi:GntR family transcriptional regulator [Sedimentitalea nanhaiensis]|uniref:Transcriptional regulator, GntR family n=1 Tax=Sedimentitalea nanhaiensis TaxID=999627 RepID=A0A1I6ZK57_9RHOB|nr:GntR family transcriptional regulator [Sedimentitalea nanhaiensis]SFT63049.1 transcriptional regulator, GntR family [Sedimentitalea nanhaiensis]